MTATTLPSPFIRSGQAMLYCGRLCPSGLTGKLSVEIYNRRWMAHDLADPPLKRRKGAEAPLCFDWTNFRTQSIAFAFKKVGTANGTQLFWMIRKRLPSLPAQEAIKLSVTLNQWAQWRLLDETFATLNRDQVTAKMTSSKASASLRWAASRMQLHLWQRKTHTASDPGYGLLQPTLDNRKGVIGTRVWICGKPVSKCFRSYNHQL